MRDHLSPIFYSGTGVILRWPQTELNASASCASFPVPPSRSSSTPADIVSYQDRQSRENFANGAVFLRGCRGCPPWQFRGILYARPLSSSGIHTMFRVRRGPGDRWICRAKVFHFFAGETSTYLLFLLRARDPGGYQFLDCWVFLFRATKVTARWGSEINAINKLA